MSILLDSSDMKQKDLLFLLLSSTFLAVVWIVFTIIHTSLTSTISGTLHQQIQPISGNFDNQTIQNIQKRLKVTPKFAIEVIESPTPTATPTLPPLQVVNPTGINATPTIIIVTPTPTQTSVTPTNTPTP